MDTNSKLDDDKRYKLDLFVKIATPVAAGLLIALAGFISERTITSVAMKQENARLITELQIRREESESALRKDIFSQAFDALLEEKGSDSSSEEKNQQMVLSDRLLKLELLALNFGDTLSLAPFFRDFTIKLDMYRESIVLDNDQRLLESDIRDRLNSLARRVASIQLSSVAQQGQLITFNVPLTPESFSLYDDKTEYKWPEDEIWNAFGGKPNLEGKFIEEKDGTYSLIPLSAELSKTCNDSNDNENCISTNLVELVKAYNESILDRSSFNVGGIQRQLRLTFSNPNISRRTIDIDLEIRTQPNKKGVKVDPVTRNFELQYYNFPKIDNTRISDGQRFALIMDKFEPADQNPSIELSAVVFPSEYASLRDRPGMQEALRLLNTVLEKQSED